MAERRRRKVKTDDDSERSFSESDAEGEDVNEAENSATETPEKSTLGKVAEDSEYESTEEKITPEVNKESKEQEPLPEVVDEEGGKEGIAETEEVEGDFLSRDPNDEASEEEEEGELEEGEYVEEERQQGDGEECSPSNAVNEKELDFDEDRRNPQYIPKKGMFYEHDDRNNEDIKEKEQEPPRDRKKKLWLDEGKWGHDRFREDEQLPKSRNELIDTYGYDIRNEDGPPRAGRRRRYGRGPTKYDRNWEDVTAYGREKFRGSPRGAPRGRRPSGRFRGNSGYRGRGRRDSNPRSPRSNESENNSNPEEVPIDRETKDTDNIDAPAAISSKDFPALPSKDNAESSTGVSQEQTNFDKSTQDVQDSKSMKSLTFENSYYGSRNSVDKDIPAKRGKTPPFSQSHDRGSRRPNSRGGRGPGRGDYSNRRGRGNSRHISPRFMENKVNNLSNDMEQLSLENETSKQVNSEAVQQTGNNADMHSTTNGSELPNMALKGAGDSSGRPKRYSSLRQRSLPETTSYQTQAPVPPPHAPYYETGYQPALYASETCVPTPSTQSQTVTTTPIINPPAYQNFTPPPYTDSYGLRMPVATPPPQLFPQVSVPAPQPLLPPPPCITAAPNLMSFAPAPPPASYHQFAYQQYAPAPPPPPAPAPPSDMYPASGITYYYPQNQPPSVRPTVHKRPKAAIPIIPPPEQETKRNSKKDSSQSSNNSDKNFSENSNEPENVDVSLRTEASSQLQPTVGVES